ncbi:hypothetical protein HDU96_005404 [Phlyctochytrium bullatum]|nr:hypothetical protein HDU96_005404 [Phlyctochytrium bullatum]
MSPNPIQILDSASFLRSSPTDLLEAICRFLTPADTLELCQALLSHDPHYCPCLVPSVSLARHQIKVCATAAAAVPSTSAAVGGTAASPGVDKSAQGGLKAVPWGMLGKEYFLALLLEVGFVRKVLDPIDPHNPSFFHRPPAFYQPPPLMRSSAASANSPTQTPVDLSQPLAPVPPHLAVLHHPGCTVHLHTPAAAASKTAEASRRPMSVQAQKLSDALSSLLRSLVGQIQAYAVAAASSERAKALAEKIAVLKRVLPEPSLASLWASRHGQSSLLLQILEANETVEAVQGAAAASMGDISNEWRPITKKDVDDCLSILGEHGHLSAMKAMLRWCDAYNTRKAVSKDDLWGDPSNSRDHALRMAARNGFADTVAFLLGDQTTAHELLAQHLVPDDEPQPPRWWVVDPTSRTDYALRWACMNGHAEILKMLLATGRCNPAAENNQAIALAAQEGRTECVRILLSLPPMAGVDPTTECDHALRWASHNGHAEVVRLLLAWRAPTPDAGTTPARRRAAVVNPAAQDDYAIRWAAHHGHTEVVRLLLGCGGTHPAVNPASQDNNPVVWAAVEGHAEIVRLLLATGKCDPTAQANYAIRRAAERGHGDVVEALLEHLVKRLGPSAKIGGGDAESDTEGRQNLARRHQLEDAYKKAVRSKHPHVAEMIATAFSLARLGIVVRDLEAITESLKMQVSAEEPSRKSEAGRGGEGNRVAFAFHQSAVTDGEGSAGNIASISEARAGPEQVQPDVHSYWPNDMQGTSSNARRGSLFTQSLNTRRLSLFPATGDRRGSVFPMELKAGAALPTDRRRGSMFPTALQATPVPMPMPVDIAEKKVKFDPLSFVSSVFEVVCVLGFISTIIFEVIGVVAFLEQLSMYGEYRHHIGKDGAATSLLMFFENRLPLMWLWLSTVWVDCSLFCFANTSPMAKVKNEIVSVHHSLISLSSRRALLVFIMRISMNALLVMVVPSSVDLLPMLYLIGCTSFIANMTANVILPATPEKFPKRLTTAMKLAAGAAVAMIFSGSCHWVTLGISTLELEATTISKGILNSVVRILAQAAMKYFMTQLIQRQKAHVLKVLELGKSGQKLPRGEFLIRHRFKRDPVVLDWDEAREIGYSSLSYIFGSYYYIPIWYIAFIGSTKTFYSYLGTSIAVDIVFRALTNRFRRKTKFLEIKSKMVEVKAQNTSEGSTLAEPAPTESVAKPPSGDFGAETTIVLPEEDSDRRDDMSEPAKRTEGVDEEYSNSPPQPPVAPPDDSEYFSFMSGRFPRPLVSKRAKSTVEGDSEPERTSPIEEQLLSLTSLAWGDGARKPTLYGNENRETSQQSKTTASPAARLKAKMKNSRLHGSFDGNLSMLSSPIRQIDMMSDRATEALARTTIKMYSQVVKPSSASKPAKRDTRKSIASQNSGTDGLGPEDGPDSPTGSVIEDENSKNRYFRTSEIDEGDKESVPESMLSRFDLKEEGASKSRRDSVESKMFLRGPPQLSKFDISDESQVKYPEADIYNDADEAGKTPPQVSQEEDVSSKQSTPSSRKAAKDFKSGLEDLQRELRDFLVEEAGNFIAETIGNYVSILTTILVGVLIVSKDCFFTPALEAELCSGGLSRIDFISRGLQVFAVRVLADVFLVYAGRSYGIPYHLARMKLTMLLLFAIAFMAAVHACLVVVAFRGAAAKISRKIPQCLPAPVPILD